MLPFFWGVGGGWEFTLLLAAHLPVAKQPYHHNCQSGACTRYNSVVYVMWVLIGTSKLPKLQSDNQFLWEGLSEGSARTVLMPFPLCLLDCGRGHGRPVT